MATTSTHTSEERRFTPDRRAGNTSVNKSTSANKLSALGWVAMVLLIVGGVNWGLVGLFSFDLVAALFGPMSLVSRVIYALVGVSALYSIYSCMKLSGQNKT